MIITPEMHQEYTEWFKSISSYLTRLDDLQEMVADSGNGSSSMEAALELTKAYDQLEAHQSTVVQALVSVRRIMKHCERVASLHLTEEELDSAGKPIEEL